MNTLLEEISKGPLTLKYLRPVKGVNMDKGTRNFIYRKIS